MDNKTVKLPAAIAAKLERVRDRLERERDVKVSNATVIGEALTGMERGERLQLRDEGRDGQ